MPSIIKNEKIKLSNVDILKIAEIFYHAIFKIYPSLEVVYSYFIK
jgi:hypothetical protein